VKGESLIYNPQTSFPNNEPTNVGLGIKPKSTWVASEQEIVLVLTENAKMRQCSLPPKMRKMGRCSLPMEKNIKGKQRE